MKRAVIVGGFTEGRRLLEPVAEAICEVGIANDGAVFTFSELLDNDLPLVLAAQKQLLITHSAGILALKKYIRPELLVAYNGPEPTSVGRLAIRAARKTVNHVAHAASGPNRYAHAKVLLGNTVELAVHPLANLSQLKTIGRYSTARQLEYMAEDGLAARAVVCDRDEFFKFDNHLLNPSGQLSYQEIPGYHDELLINPKTVLAKTFPDL